MSTEGHEVENPTQHSLTSGDIRWVLKRLGINAASSVLPIGAHLRVARLKSCIYRRVWGVPPHVRDNLASVLGDTLEPSELDSIARRHVEFLKRFYLQGVLSAHSGFHTPHRWPLEGRHHLESALAKGRGALLVTAHLGYARMTAAILRAHGFDAKRVVAKSMDQVARDVRWIEWLDAGGWVRGSIAPVIKKILRTQDIAAQLDIRPILLELSRNKPIMIAGDGLRAAEFVMLSLLGKPHPFATGFMKIALITEAAVLPCFVVEEDKDTSIRLIIEPALDLDPAANIEENVFKFVEVLEQQIRRAPHLWSRWSIENTFEKAEKWIQGGIQDRWNQSFKSWTPE